MVARVRNARCCTKCHWRSMDEADFECPEHGARATYTELNRPYFGRPVPQAPGYDEKRYQAGAKARAKMLEGER